MSYKLVKKHFLAKRNVFRFTVTQQCIFRELLDIAGKGEWKDEFTCENQRICTPLRIGPKTLQEARDKFIEAGLMEFTSGKQERKPGVYRLIHEKSEKSRAAAKGQGKEKEIFEAFRRRYPGTKRGLDTEFANFVKKHTDHKQVVELLLPAIEKQIAWRCKKIDMGVFVPEYPLLQTWINQRRWENEQETHYYQ